MSRSVHDREEIRRSIDCNKTALMPGKLITAILFIVVGAMTGLVQGETTGPEKGVLFVHGGGALDVNEFVALVRDASGKDQPRVLVITTPQGKRRSDEFQRGIPFHMVTTLRQRYGLKHVTELYTLSKEEADTSAFYGQIDNADAVFISGGNQCFLTDAFLETETLAALKRLLKRGGVIAGSSAGAQVQSSFMTRGDYTERKILGDKKHQEGFSFVANAAFDVHVEERGREDDLFEVFRAKKSELQDRELDPFDLLGIGIDQGTAVVVTQDEYRVIGTGQVYVFDPEKWQDDPDSWAYQTLKPGTIFDMKLRKVTGVSAKSRRPPAASQEKATVPAGSGGR